MDHPVVVGLQLVADRGGGEGAQVAVGEGVVDDLDLSQRDQGLQGGGVGWVPVVLVDPTTGRQAKEGEICIDLSRRPTGLMTGYQLDDERNNEAMSGGNYHTGDVASRDDDGYIF